MSQDVSYTSRKFAICVGGVSGSGKTTLLREHAALETRDVQVTGSSIVKSIIAPATVHDLDSWSLERRQAVREQSIQELRKIQEQITGRLLIDGHFTLRNRTSGLLEAIFTPEDKAFFQALVLIHPSPEWVQVRRMQDGRVRSVESIADIAAHIDAELLEGRQLAKDMGVPLLELVESDLSQRLDALAQFLEKFTPLESR